MKKLYCFLLLVIFSLTAISGCANEEAEDEQWTKQEVFGTYTVSSIQDVPLYDNLLNKVIIITNLEIRVIVPVPETKMCYFAIEGIDFMIIYLDIPYYSCPYKIGDIISVKGFCCYANSRYNLSPCIVINTETPAE